MKQTLLNIIFKTGAIGLVALVLNLIFIRISVIPDVAYHYPLYIIYLVFWVMTVIVLAVLNLIHQKNPAQTGYVFLFMTTAQLAIAYVLAKPLLAKTIDGDIEKYNFFIVFLLFLATEAYYTARLLNNK